MRISFDGRPCVDVVVTGPMTAVCTTPPHAAGSVSVMATNPNGQQVTLAHAFTYVEGWSSFLPLIVP